jgi:hypothetical protein
MKPYQTVKDSDRASAPELRGGLPTEREALRPSEPRHSPDKATPSCYTKNESFPNGISKVWCVCSDFHRRGVFIGLWGSSTDLSGAVPHQVAADLAMWPAGWVEWLPLPSSTFLAIPFCVETCPQSYGPNRLKTWTVVQGVGPPGHPLGPLVSDPCTLPPRVRYTPGVKLILVEFEISL